MMIAAFSFAIASTVAPRRSVWSSVTLVTAAQPHLDHRQIDAGLGEPHERDRGQQLELRGVAVAAGNAIGQRQYLRGKPRERVLIDRNAPDLQALPVGNEMGLGRLTDPVSGRGEGRPRQRQDAAFAVGAGDQGAAEGKLGVAQSGQEGARTAEAQPNPESSARFERGKRPRVAEPVRRQSFVRSSS
jgi:hypothetical protein